MPKDLSVVVAQHAAEIVYESKNNVLRRQLAAPISLLKQSDRRKKKLFFLLDFHWCAWFPGNVNA